MTAEADEVIDQLSPFVCDPDARNIERPFAHYSDFALDRCEPFPHQVQQLGRESRYKCIVGAVGGAGAARRSRLRRNRRGSSCDTA
jgi:hypothetical protein